MPAITVIGRDSLYQGGYFTMKKKIVCVLVMAMMTVSLAGCGGAKKAESTAASTAAAASTAVSAAAEAVSEAASAAAGAVSEAASAATSAA